VLLPQQMNLSGPSIVPAFSGGCFFSKGVLSRGAGSLLLYLLNDSVLVILLVPELAFKSLGLSYELPRSTASNNIDSILFDEDMLGVSLFARSSAVRQISGAQRSWR
jgi:hypothetical protein